MEIFQVKSILKRIAKSVYSLKLNYNGEEGFVPVDAQFIDMNFFQLIVLYLKGAIPQSIDRLSYDKNLHDYFNPLFKKPFLLKYTNYYYLLGIIGWRIMGIKFEVKMFPDRNTLEMMAYLGKLSNDQQTP